MSIDLAPEELADTATETPPCDSESWLPEYIVAVDSAIAHAGIDELQSITHDDIESWSPEVRAAVIAWCRQPNDDSPDIAMPDVLRQYFPETEEDAEEPADEAGPVDPASTALVPVDAIASGSAPADSLLPSTIVDVVTEAEFASRLDSKMDEFAADIQALDAWMASVHAATAETDAAEREYLSLKEQASEAKKVYEAKVIALRSITRSQPGPQREFPFDGEHGATSVDEQGAEPSTQASDGADPSTPATADLDAAADERSWRAWPLSRVDGIPEKKLAALAQANIETVGQLADLTTKHGLFWFRDIKGIGESMAAKISDAVAKFHMERPDRKAAQAGEAATQAVNP